MPVLQISRQPDAMAWFDTVKGGSLLATEREIIRTAFIARPMQQPWLWVAPQGRPTEAEAETEEPQLPHRSLKLHPDSDHYVGSVQCSLPLPLPNESIGNLILQHALDTGREELLEECVRVLEPGGRLWLFVLNPWSPYRARWRHTGLQARDANYWQHRLRVLGLQPCGREVSYLGPTWRVGSESKSPNSSRFRAVCLLEAEKRTAALIPPAPVKRQWQADAAPA